MKKENEIVEGVSKIKGLATNNAFYPFAGLYLGERIWDCSIKISGEGINDLIHEHGWEGWDFLHPITIDADQPRHIHGDFQVTFWQGGTTAKYLTGTIRIDMDLLPGESRSFVINDKTDIIWPQEFSCSSSWLADGGIKIGKSWVYTKSQCDSKFATK